MPAQSVLCIQFIVLNPQYLDGLYTLLLDCARAFSRHAQLQYTVAMGLMCLQFVKADMVEVIRNRHKRFPHIAYHVQQKFSGSNSDGSFTTAIWNLFLSP